MIFVIDIGNTNVCLAGVEEGEVRFTHKLPTDSSLSAEEYQSAIEPILGDPCAYRGAVLSSVVPRVAETVAEAVGTLMGRAVQVVTRHSRTGLTIDLPEPDRVGRDRLVDAAWAAEHLPLPAVTADLGTATTLNVILPGKVFAGGVICTGIQTGLKALAQQTAQLPKVELRIPDSIIGRNTEQCMLSGAVAGTAAMVDGLVTGIEQELGTPVTLILTGGGGRYVTKLLRHEHIYDPDLILKGLALIYEMNERG